MEINYSQVRIKEDTLRGGKKGGCGYIPVGGSINSPPQQTKYPAELLGVNYRNSTGYPPPFFKERERRKDLINETVTTVMFVGIKGGWEV